MKFANKKKKVIIRKRALRVRDGLCGTAERPRMCVVKTSRHIHVQLIDDVNGKTVVSVSTQDKEVQAAGCKHRSIEAGKIVGEKVGLRSKEKGIMAVIFDRGSSKYHGILAAVADSARQQGLQF